VGHERRTLRGVELQADRVAELAHRPVAQLRRRDVAIALLTVAAEDALTSLPAIRRGLLAAGNPLSAPFWDSTEAILQKISGHEATFGDVHGWLEATGTEPTAIIGLHVWEEPDARSPLQEEMHARLVGYLEERVAAGEIDPDDLATGNEEARREYLAVQERWMTTPLPDGRVPMTVLLDEQDEAFLADWAAADAEARAALQSVLETVALPADAAELWLTLAASVAAPQGDPLSEEDKEFARAMEWAEDEDLDFGDALDDADGDEEPDEMSAAIAAVCALDHFDWLAVMSSLVTGGPGTPASAADLARYVRDFDPDKIVGLSLAVLVAEDDDFPDEDEDEGADGESAELDPTGFEDYDDFDELSIEGLFLHVTSMWSVLGAIDDDDRLTPLGWWGLPEAMRRAWAE